MKELNELIEKWKTEFLANLCSECPGACCYYNLSGLTEEQAKLIFGISNLETDIPLNSRGELVIEKEDSGLYKTNYPMFPTEDDHCPQLVDGNCAIYDNELKPSGCSNFPIGVDEVNRRVNLHNMVCPGVSLEHQETVDLCLSTLDLGFDVNYMFGLTKGLTRTYIICNSRRRTV